MNVNKIHHLSPSQPIHKIAQRACQDQGESNDFGGFILSCPENDDKNCQGGEHGKGDKKIEMDPGTFISQYSERGPLVAYVSKVQESLQERYGLGLRQMEDNKRFGSLIRNEHGEEYDQ